jgi:isoamylase
MATPKTNARATAAPTSLVDSLRLESREEGATTVVRFQGMLAGSLSEEHRERVTALVQSQRPIVMDFSGLTGFSGPGLRKLLQFCRRVRASGGKLSGRGASAELVARVDAAGFLDLLQSDSLAGASQAHAHATVAPRIDVYPTRFHEGYGIRPGAPLPLGASVIAGGVNFAVFSRHATACTLVLFEPGRSAPLVEIPFPPDFRVGDVFTMTVFDLDPEEIEYGFRLDGPLQPERGHRFDATQTLIDPMARSLSGREVWGQEPDPSHRPVYRSRLIPEDFDWEGDQPLQHPFEDLVIYEAHVRAMTASPTAGVMFPGTFAGLREKIPYLKELGINCLELLPVFQFNECDNDRKNPLTNERLYNFWGYNTIGFYAPHAGFAATAAMGTQADELKALVKDLHQNGIEVLLDVVFNHTAEGNENGPMLSFRGLDNRTYYMLTPRGEYLNYSGCGNTLNCNHPVVRDFVVSCLRYWVSEYHIDGFRFDLASILGRASDGTPLANPPLLEALAMDPVLGKTKLIAEAWDAGGLYQVGSFPAYGRWAEWNGKYRDCIRKAIKSDVGQMGELAQRLTGSPDLYPTRGPTASINFVTCHDGFTLADLVSYNSKHNEANGEDNRDGGNDNHCWNCGVEGATSDREILALRRQLSKNALALLFLSQGVPMLLMGDEIGRSQSGNNNAYCHDGPLSWMDWTQQSQNADLFRFCQTLIALRQRHPVLRRRYHAGWSTPESGAFEIAWHGTQTGRPDWSEGSRVLALTLKAATDTGFDVVHIALNMYWAPLDFEVPPPPPGYRWHLSANTANPSPNDIHTPGSEPPLPNATPLRLAGRSIVVLVACPSST